MGLGGHLTWTAAAREIKKKTGLVSVPVNGNNIVTDDIFKNNPNFSFDTSDGKEKIILDLGKPETNYCIADLPDRAIQKTDKHIIETICEHYDILDPELKCDLFFTEEELEKARGLIKDLPLRFLVIEPHSKTSYSINRQYPLDKWQKVVNELSEKFPIVQVGVSGKRVLDSVVDLTGQTTFREAAAIIRLSSLLLSNEGGLGHAATATETKALIVLGGYTGAKMVCYPQNINIDVATHGPCGMKSHCSLCQEDYENHNYGEIVERALEVL